MNTLPLFLAARLASHWTATHKRGHDVGFLKTFLLASLAFTLAHAVFQKFSEWHRPQAEEAKQFARHQEVLDRA